MKGPCRLCEGMYQVGGGGDISCEQAGEDLAGHSVCRHAHKFHASANSFNSLPQDVNNRKKWRAIGWRMPNPALYETLI